MKQRTEYSQMKQSLNMVRSFRHQLADGIALKVKTDLLSELISILKEGRAKVLVERDELTYSFLTLCALSI